MVLASRGLGGAHYRSTRAVKDQPDCPFHSKRNQAIYHDREHGRYFKHHFAYARRSNQSVKGEQEQVGDPVDQGNYRTAWIGTNEHQCYAKHNEHLDYPEQQPDQLGGFKKVKIRCSLPGSCCEEVISVLLLSFDILVLLSFPSMVQI
jgi:hypothetical protein